MAFRLVAMTWMALCAVGRASETELERFEYGHPSMGAEVRLLFYAASEDEARTAAEAAFARVDELERCLSPWRADSEVSMFCLGPGVHMRPVSGDLFWILSLSRDFGEASNGAFDPTILPLTRLWAQAERNGKVPDPTLVERTLERIGWEAIELNRSNGTAGVRMRRLGLDFGSIGRGYACDEALAILVKRGLPRALVSIGGDLVAGDPPPGLGAWTVPAGCDAMEGIDVVREAVATAGGAERSFEVGGRSYSHLIDPRTGQPLEAGVCATVVAPSGAVADALSTIVCVLGPRASRAVLREFNARLVSDPDFEPCLDGAGSVDLRAGGGEDARTLEVPLALSNFDLEFEARATGLPLLDVGLRRVSESESTPVRVSFDLRRGRIAETSSSTGSLHEGVAGDSWRNGAFNHVRISCVGFDPRVSVWLNGLLVSEASLPGPLREGTIELRVTGQEEDSVELRRVRVRERETFDEDAFATLPTGRLDLSGEGQQRGWRPLLRSWGITGWEVVGERSGYEVVDGVLRIPAAGPGGGGHLRTVDDYRDFRLHLEFRVTEMARGGLFLRAERGGEDPASSGREIRILDDFHREERTGARLEPEQFTGSLDGLLAPATRALRGPEQWNVLEVLYRGSRLAVALNGKLLHDVDAQEVGERLVRESGIIGERLVRESGFIGLRLVRESGFIGLRRSESDAEERPALFFRNLFVRELQP